VDDNGERANMHVFRSGIGRLGKKRGELRNLLVCSDPMMSISQYLI
jgi:hypothetical protein